MLGDITYQFITEQLKNFIMSPRCCQQICGSFRPSEHVYIAREAKKLGCQTLPYVQNGVKTIKVYKRFCFHYLDNPINIKLEINSTKDLLQLHERESFLGSHFEMQVSLDMFNLGNTLPVVPPHRFSIGPLKQSMVRLLSKNALIFQRNNTHSYKQLLLEALQRNRIIIVNGDPSFNKSTALPLYIIGNCLDNHIHCKIICVEREQLLAVYKSERLANQLGEKVGNTVAFQVHLQSRISETSNLIYTTANFLLRVLMGQSIVDSFRHISHIIVGDVHLHEAFADILLSELRNAIRCHSHLRVILLSNSSKNIEFLNYFGEGEEIHLMPQNNELKFTPPNILYLSDIKKLITVYKMSRQPLITRTLPSKDIIQNENEEYLDRCLEAYDRLGTEETLQTFLYMVHTEYASINYRHSVMGSTAIIIAGKFGNPLHIRVLLEMHADPFIVDEQNVNALSSAVSSGNLECIELLNKYCNESCLPNERNASIFDATFVTDLIQMILTHCDWKPGNILVCAPDYENIVRLNFSILRHQLIGNIPQDVSINMLHSNIEKEHLAGIIEGNTNSIKIILATEIAEAIDFLGTIMYVIDSARIRRVYYNTKSDCKESKVEWISRESLETRASLLFDSEGNTIGTCFRLISPHLVNKLPSVRTPELLTIPLDRVCLTVKLLSHHTMIAEYLKDTIICPPFINVHQTIEYLKKIDILDELEDVTWLGCRLIDVPIDCQLGKLLVLAIVLQCLDPILTIVSFLSTADPLELPNESDGGLEPFISRIRYKIKKERNRLAQGIYADPLIYLRLYQEWQNELRDENPTMALIDEYHFFLNGLLERVCDMRTHLVGALRSSQLIHNQGHLSMHYINLKSNSWPIIKAALVAGLYPQICYLDKNIYRFKSTKNKELVLHPSSVLRKLPLQPMQILTKTYTSQWVVYACESSSIYCNNINCCTLIAPLPIVLFAGSSKINASNLIAQTTNNVYSNVGINTSIFYLDDWISFVMKSDEAQLILKTRQYFYSIYTNYLQYCGSMDKWRRTNVSFTQNPRLFDTLEKILTEEDKLYGFVMPENVGLRPKAMPNRFLTTYNSQMFWEHDTIPNTQIATNQAMTSVKQKMVNVAKCTINNRYDRFLEKQFFLFYISESTNVLFRKYANDWLRESVAKIVEPLAISSKLTYVIIYKKNPDVFCAVAIARNSGVFRLEECFKNQIPIFELIMVLGTRMLLCTHLLAAPHRGMLQDSFTANIFAGNILDRLGKPNIIYTTRSISTKYAPVQSQQSIFELNICHKINLSIPTFNERRALYKIDKRIGGIILNLFAFRNNWLYDN